MRVALSLSPSGLVRTVVAPGLGVGEGEVVTKCHGGGFTLAGSPFPDWGTGKGEPENNKPGGAADTKRQTGLGSSARVIHTHNCCPAC